MESRRKSQVLVCLTLFSLLLSQTLAWPLFEAPFLRNARHTKEVSTRGDERFLSQPPAKIHLQSSIGKRDSKSISEDNGTVKIQLDTIDTNQLTRSRKKLLVEQLLKEIIGISNEEKIRQMMKNLFGGRW